MAGYRENMTEKSRTVYLIARLYYLVREQMDAELAKEEITSVQYTVLSLIRGSDGLSSAQLARRYRVKPQSMHKTVRDLEAAGLIERAAGWENKKALVAVLSEKGRERLARCDTLIDAYERQLFRDAPAEDLEAFRRVAKSLMERPGP
jgi:DNA-binding MarR family transcriptional regulator